MRGAGAGCCSCTDAVVAVASTCRAQERVAEQFRAGPVFLVSHAAHTHSPVRGSGHEHRDAGRREPGLEAPRRPDRRRPEVLLDTYPRERQPVAAQLVAFTCQFVRIAALADPAAGRRRNALLAAAAAT